MLTDQPGQLTRQGVQSGIEELECLARQEHGGGVEHVLGGRPVMHPLRLLVGQSTFYLRE